MRCCKQALRTCDPTPLSQARELGVSAGLDVAAVLAGHVDAAAFLVPMLRAQHQGSALVPSVLNRLHADVAGWLLPMLTCDCADRAVPSLASDSPDLVVRWGMMVTQARAVAAGTPPLETLAPFAQVVWKRTDADGARLPPNDEAPKKRTATRNRKARSTSGLRVKTGIRAGFKHATMGFQYS